MRLLSVVKSLSPRAAEFLSFLSPVSLLDSSSHWGDVETKRVESVLSNLTPRGSQESGVAGPTLVASPSDSRVTLSLVLSDLLSDRGAVTEMIFLWTVTWRGSLKPAGTCGSGEGAAVESAGVVVWIARSVSLW